MGIVGKGISLSLTVLCLTNVWNKFRLKTHKGNGFYLVRTLLIWIKYGNVNATS